MGGDTTQVSESGLSNEAMKKAATTLGNQLNTQLGAGVKPYAESMVPELSSQTTAGIGGLTNNPNNPAYGNAISTAIQQQGDIATGNFGNDPYRNRLIDDVTTATNAAFQGSGRFGSASNKDALGDSLIGTLGAYDQSRQNAALAALPQLYSASNMPASAQLQAGQTMDAYNNAVAQDQARIFDATQNAGWNTLQRGSSIFAGTAPVSGTTSTQTTTQPWWVAPTAIAGTLGSAFL